MSTPDYDIIFSANGADNGGAIPITLEEFISFNTLMVHDFCHDIDNSKSNGAFYNLFKSNGGHALGAAGVRLDKIASQIIQSGAGENRIIDFNPYEFVAQSARTSEELQSCYGSKYRYSRNGLDTVDSKDKLLSLFYGRSPSHPMGNDELKIYEKTNREIFNILYNISNEINQELTRPNNDLNYYFLSYIGEIVRTHPQEMAPLREFAVWTAGMAAYRAEAAAAAGVPGVTQHTIIEAAKIAHDRAAQSTAAAPHITFQELFRTTRVEDIMNTFVNKYIIFL